MQADAFNGYDGIYLESQGRIIEVACWAHARRKFHECRHLDSARMETALAWIGKLYAVEKDLRERCQGEWQKLALEERAVRIAAERQERSRPLLDGFHSWLEAEAPKVLPKSAVRGAMDYTLYNWAALSVYPDDGWLDIDNNEGENAVRGIALGAQTGFSAGATAAAVRRQSISACWPPASVTATIPGSISATYSPVCPPCFPGQAKKTFSRCCPTSGNRPDRCLARRPPRAAGDFLLRVLRDAYLHSAIAHMCGQASSDIKVAVSDRTVVLSGTTPTLPMKEHAERIAQ